MKRKENFSMVKGGKQYLYPQLCHLTEAQKNSTCAFFIDVTFFSKCKLSSPKQTSQQSKAREVPTGNYASLLFNTCFLFKNKCTNLKKCCSSYPRCLLEKFQQRNVFSIAITWIVHSIWRFCSLCDGFII